MFGRQRGASFQARRKGPGTGDRPGCAGTPLSSSGWSASRSHPCTNGLRSGRQTFAALGAAARQNLDATSRFHALAEAMAALAHKFARLIRALHGTLRLRQPPAGPDGRELAISLTNSTSCQKPLASRRADGRLGSVPAGMEGATLYEGLRSKSIAAVRRQVHGQGREHVR